MSDSPFRTRVQSDAPSRRRTQRIGTVATLLLCLACWGDSLDDAIALQERGEYEASLEILSKLLDENVAEPNPRALYYFGTALSATGRESQAVWSLREAMESPEWLHPAARLLAANALKAQNHDLAIEVMNRVLTADPDDVPSLETRAHARLMTRRDYAGALDDAEHALEVDPDSLSARVAQIVALLGLNRVDEAEPLIEELEDWDLAADLGASPDAYTAVWCLGRAQFAAEKGLAEKAQAIYRECAERYPRNSQVISRMIENLDGNGQHAEALEFVREVFERLGGRDYRTNLVRRLEMRGRSDEADQVLLQATEHPAAAVASGAWEDLAGLRTARGDKEGGLLAFERAVERAPAANPLLLFAYTEALIGSGELEQAQEIASQIEVRVYRELALGRVLLARGEYASALERFGQGNLLWPNRAASRFYTALAAEGAGDIDRAKEEYRAAIRSDVSATDARRRLAELHLADREYGAAFSALGHGRRDDPTWGVDDALLQLELLGLRRINPEGFTRSAAAIGSDPQQRARALARYAAGLRVSLGPQAAADVVHEATALDLRDPVNAPALQSLVTDLIELDRGGEALTRARAAVAAHPDAAAFQEILGVVLEAHGGSRDEIYAVFARAVELAPNSSRALAGLARQLAARGETASALSLLERASQVPDDDPEPELALAKLLVAASRGLDAEATLRNLLERQPTDARAALQLAELRSQRLAPDRDRTLSLARRAQRFRAGPEADRLIAELTGATQGARPAGARSSQPGAS